MSRWENEDISDLNLPDQPARTEMFLGVGGHNVEEGKAYAKIVTTNTNDKEEQRFYIRFGRGELLDAHRGDKRINNKIYAFRKVSKNTFDHYMQYLTNKNSLYFTKARRSLMGE